MFNSNAFITACMITSRNYFILNLALVDYFGLNFLGSAAEDIVLQTKTNIELKAQNGTPGINVKDVLRFLLALMRISHIGQ